MHAVMFVFAKFYFQGRLGTNSSTSIGDNDPSRFLHANENALLLKEV